MFSWQYTDGNIFMYNLINADTLNVVHIVVVLKKKKKLVFSLLLKRKNKLFCRKIVVSCGTFFKAASLLLCKGMHILKLSLLVFLHTTDLL